MAEVLATVALLALAIGPALTALQGAVQSTEVDVIATTNDYRLLEKIEELMAAPFYVAESAVAGESTPSGYSDTVGTTDRRLVFIANYDVDNVDGDNDPFTDTENDVLWIKVQIEGSVHALESLKGDP